MSLPSGNDLILSNNVPNNESALLDVTMTTPEASTSMTPPPSNSTAITVATLPSVAEATTRATASVPMGITTTVSHTIVSNAPSSTGIISTASEPESVKRAGTRQKVIDIIDYQFDLEILLRHAESAAIAQELAKAERMLEDLRHAILSERQGSPYGNSTTSRTLGLQNQQQNQYYSSRQSSRRATANYIRDQRQAEALYAVRADGQFVRMGCPRCDRYDFGSIQGLVNHMRLSHKLVFKNTEESVRYCGVVVPTIKTYDEDVDLESEDGHARSNSRTASGVSQPPRRNSGASVNSSSNGGSESDSDSSGVVSGGESGISAGIRRRRSSLALSITRPQKGKPGSKPDINSDSDASDDNDDSGGEVPRRPTAGKGPMRKYGALSQGPMPTVPNGDQKPRVDTSHSNISSQSGSVTPYGSVLDSRMSSAASSRATSPTIHPLMNENDTPDPSIPSSRFPTPLTHIASSHPNVAITTPHAAAHTAGLPIVQQQHKQQLQPTIITFGANAIHSAGVPAPLDTVGSRFYVKRRMVIGNVSKYLPENKRDPRLKDFPYKWMIYVDGTPKPEDITAYISKVEFHLHESYKPNHIITVSEPPFHLSRYAWGETQIKVRLFFHDARNKPVEIYHRLALDPTHCGRQVHGRERHVDLELDRNTAFLPVTPFQPRSKNNSNKLGARNNLILNSAAEMAMADGAEEDEQELQNTLARPSSSSATSATTVGDTNAAVDTVCAASVDGGSTMQLKAKETALSYCKACGSLWKQHRDNMLGVANNMSEPMLLNEVTGQRIVNCPHHPTFYAVKDLGEDEKMLLSLLTGRSKNKFALDMLKGCGIVDQNGRPISSRDRMMMELQQQQSELDSAMDLDIGDSELPPQPPQPAANLTNMLLTPTLQTKVQQLTEAFQKMEVYKCRRSEIDWVLSVMDELKLKTLSLDGGAGAGTGGSRSGLRERDQEQELLLNTPGQENVPQAMQQRAVVGGLLVQATKAFLGSMLSKAIQIHRAETEAEKGPGSIMMELDALHEPSDDTQNLEGSGSKEIKVSDKLLAPYHIYQALQNNPEELDFLTSQYEDMEGIGEMMVGL
ncbi:YEATS domain-containing protein 2 [Haplosporangium sp. Z 767]|nr:YEATS domain-containing protein 2 [Haplosporangium sp. Z 767]